MAEKRKEIKPDYGKIIKALEQATSLSISFVFFPVILLLIGVFLDKKFNTVPGFILASIVSGIIIFMYQVRRALKGINKNK